MLVTAVAVLTVVRAHLRNDAAESAEGEAHRGHVIQHEVNASRPHLDMAARGTPAEKVIVSQTGPTDVKKWEGSIQSWKTDGIDRRFYSDDDAMQVIRDVVPTLADTVAGFRTPVEKADIFRLAVLFRDGGVYADLDQELTDKTMLMNAVASGLTMLPLEKSQADHNDRSLLGQSIMISPPGQTFFLRAIEWMVKRYNPSCYEVDNTGPDALVAFFVSTGGCEYWGKHGVVVLQDMMTSGTNNPPAHRLVSHHHATGTWRTEDSFALRKARFESAYACADASQVRDFGSSTCMGNYADNLSGLATMNPDNLH
jgi:hypothetical protein